MTGTSSRMLALLSLLQVPRHRPGHVLAARLEVTPRTVRRDVDRLRALGYRISATKGPAGGYRLEAGTELPPLRFDGEQAVAVAIALRSAPALGVEIDEAAQRALATIRQVMPAALRHRVDGVRFTGSSGSSPAVAPEVLEAVSEAVRRRMTLRFGYRDPEGISRRTHPHGLVARAGHWYVVAWDLDREEWRIFRLDRMTPRFPSGPAFRPRPVPTGDALTFLSARSKGAQDVDRWPCTGRAEIMLPSAEVAPWIRDGEVEALTSNSTRVTIGSWSWTGVLTELLRFDADFRILGPAELTAAAERLGNRLQRSRRPPRREP